MLLLLGKGIRLHALFSVLLLKERVEISNYFPELKEQHITISCFFNFSHVIYFLRKENS